MSQFDLITILQLISALDNVKADPAATNDGNPIPGLHLRRIGYRTDSSCSSTQ